MAVAVSISLVEPNVTSEALGSWVGFGVEVAPPDESESDPVPAPPEDPVDDESH